MRDLHNTIAYERAISPVFVANNTAQVSQIIDLLGATALEFVIALGVLSDSDATFAVLVEEGDDSGLSDNTAVADADLLGTESGAGFVFSGDNTVEKIGYRGIKRYVRLTITPSGNTANAFMSAIAAVYRTPIAP